VIQSPVAVIAGTISTAACVSRDMHMHPLLQWSLAIIAGGGAAGSVQITTVLARLASTATTGGFGNWVVATLEVAMSMFLSLLAFLSATFWFVVPILAVVLLSGLGITAFVMVRSIQRLLRKRAQRAVLAKA
jgi:hypothetical protein